VILSKNDAFIKLKMRKERYNIKKKRGVKIGGDFCPHFGFI